MEDVVHATFFSTCLAVVAVWGLDRSFYAPEVVSKKTPEFKSFQQNYLLVYLLAMFSDWMKGPYLYALYAHYGFHPENIAILFITGYLSSLFFGTIAGVMSDKFGRRAMCIVFGLCYIADASVKLSNDFWLLMAGRVMSGIATSLLFSVFEAWMVCEHKKRNYSEALLVDTFALASTGNGLCAVAAGLVGTALVDNFGILAPPIFTILPLLVVIAVVMLTWTENFGDQSISYCGSLGAAWSAIQDNQFIALLGITQSAFQGAMYIFVFAWTPALESPITDTKLPHGLIFSTFMAAVMLGGSLFSLYTKIFDKDKAASLLPLAVHFGATAAMLWSSYGYNHKVSVLCAFLFFELCCGVFFPVAGLLRSVYIPEQSRAGVMNLFRLPLNAVVVILLLLSQQKEAGHEVHMLYSCAVLHLVGLVCYFLFVTLKTATSKSDHSVRKGPRSRGQTKPAASYTKISVNRSKRTHKKDKQSDNFELTPRTN